MIQPINQNTNIQLPSAQRNYTVFDWNKVNSVVAQREKALPQIKQVLETSQDEKQIVENLYIVDRMIDNNVKGIPAMYPTFAKFNNTQSPNIQSFLAGIYRKTQVPDAFGPLVKMLIQNSVKSPQNQNVKAVQPSFDPNEEIGGAILEYIRNYSNNPKKIDYTA